MKSAIFFNSIKSNENNKEVIKTFESYSRSHENTVLYLINSPLGEHINYQYQDKAIVVLSPGYKIIFIDLCNESEFDNFCDDFISDLGFISSKYKYQEHIGRTREWKDKFTAYYNLNNGPINVEDLLSNNKLDKADKRKSELIISLLTGSINDIEKIGIDQPQTLLEKIKNKIILFDAEQTRFIYQEYAIKKIISVQGLSGTGKTELLLHKLKDIYTQSDDTKIFFTCHNIALAKKLKQRVAPFFDFMKVNKQIKWDERLWVTHAWGSYSNVNSGLYSYICNFYQLNFHKYGKGISYDFIFAKALEEINKIPSKEFRPCFDYIFVDESQDFPDVFFDLCKKIVKEKVYIAGDVFQDIFGAIKRSPRGVDITLNRCYRTDPRTLMFAHSIGLGLFEEEKLNWFKKDEWEHLGYKIVENSNKKTLKLSRYPIQRFEELNIDSSVIISEDTKTGSICSIIKKLQEQNEDLQPDDIAIIIVDDDPSIYKYIDNLCLEINRKFKWKVCRGYESKEALINHIYITNPNNVKGLEFPYVICLTHKIINTYKYRNTLYTMLTRSFLQSFLLVSDNENLDVFEEGLKSINKNLYIETKIPTEEQIQKIKQTILEYKDEGNQSYEEFLEEIFKQAGVEDEKSKSSITQALEKSKVKKFDKENTLKFIENTKSFY